MKNRRIVIVAFMLVAALCLGIGYAATVNDTLTASGTLPGFNVEEQFNIAVQFEDVSSTNKTTKNDVELASGVMTSIEDDTNGDASDLFSVTIDKSVFTAKGDEVKIYVGVKNDSAKAINVTITPATVDTDLFTVEFSGDATMAATTSAVYELTITLKALPVDAPVDSATFSFTLTAELV